MPTISQIHQRNKREALARAQRLAFEAKVNALDKILPADTTLEEKTHQLLLANRPGAAGEIAQADEPIAQADEPIAQIAGETAHASTPSVENDPNEALPKSLTPAQTAAASLTTEYPHLAARIAAALALVETATFDPDRYDTRWDNAGRVGTWHCDCPDATHRGEELSTRYGAGCKHAMAGLILQLVEQERQAVTWRKYYDKLTRQAAADSAAAQRGLNAALAPGGGRYNPAHRPMAQFLPRQGWGR